MLFAFDTYALLLGAVSATCAKAAWSPDNCDDNQLLIFQVSQPPPVPSHCHTCTVKILERTFGNSYEDPEIVQYFPPTDCGEPGSWAAVTLNFTATSKGSHYDRLGFFTFQNTEIWRTSTPEPTYDGIIWTYIKDVTRYIPLFTEPGPFMLELRNLSETGPNGSYSTTLHATFYAASKEYPTAGQSNLIVPISTMSNTSADDASVPPAFSVNITLPQNTVEIYAELYASGQGEEEFWYYNVETGFISFIPPGTTYGGAPFREVRLLVDGQIAGVAFPYAVIFPGGINPFMWRPITSYGALDFPTYFIDLTPFAPTFADGLPHNVTLDVATVDVPEDQLNPSWYVSGLLQVVTDPSGKPTTGGITSYDVQPPFEGLVAIIELGAPDVEFITVAERSAAVGRSLHIEAVVVSGSGQVNSVSFDQNLTFTSYQYFLNNSYTQNVAQVSSGSVLSLHNGVQAVVDNFEYLLDVNLTYLEATNTSDAFYTSISQSYQRQLSPAPFILGSTIAESQQAAGYFTIDPTCNSGNGTNNNTFSYTDMQGNTYYRNVSAAYDVIVYDEQGGSLAMNSLPPATEYWEDVQSNPLVRLPGGRSSNSPFAITS